ncbi:endonuclease/exonuclease/phosphatase family protein [Chitinophaga lutea]
MKKNIRQTFLFLTLVWCAGMLFSCKKSVKPNDDSPGAGLRSNAPATPLAELKVMSYNIHAGIGIDGVYNLQRIADVIRNSGADVITLNEVHKNYDASTNYEDQVTWLATELGMYSAFQKTTWKSPIAASGNKERQFGHAILSKYPIEVRNARIFTAYITHYHGLLETRIVVDGHPILFYSTHLAVDSATLSQQRQQLRTWMDESAGTKILMGDLNAVPTNANILSLKETLVDSFEGAVTSYTFKANNPTIRIDYILGSSNITFSNSQVISTQASDHLPIVSDVSVGASKLRLMQYNMRHGEGTDGVVNLQRIADVIRASKAQVVVLNEIDRNYDPRSNYVDQLAWLASELGMYYEFQKTTWKSPIAASGNKERQFGHGVLSKYPIGDSSQQGRWIYADYSTHYMGLLKVRISVNANPLYVYITNLGSTAAERLSQAQEMMSYVTPPNHTWKVIAGTISDIPGSAPVGEITASFTDVFSGQTAYTYPANAPDRRVDYIFVKSPVAASNASVISSLASTHLPIICDIEMQ